jgi:uncharacterized protein YdhG (YjbR/CyaY superfamily)
MQKRVASKSIDDYIRRCEPGVQATLRKLRQAIKARAPGATEKISYQIPTFYLNGNLVHFAAFKHHIGFYPTSSAIAAFAPELGRYKWSKGAVQFPIDKPMPLELILRMVDFRVAECVKKRTPRGKVRA